MAGLGSRVASPEAFFAIETAVAAAVPARWLSVTPPLICTTFTRVAQPSVSLAATSSRVRPQLMPSVRGTGRSAVR